MPDALVAPTLLTWRLLGYYLFIALGAYLFTHQVHRAYRRRESADETPPPSPSPAEESSSPVLSDQPE
jgi:hypothetical protein